MLELIKNEIFLATVFATVLAQLIKAIIDTLHNKKFHRSSLFRWAWMPSSHTSTVVALAISVYLVEWINTIFIITLIFASIVVRDVIWDKVFATQQQNLINTIIQDIVENKKIERNHLIWHTSLEVFFWIIVAIISVTIVFTVL